MRMTTQKIHIHKNMAGQPQQAFEHQHWWVCRFMSIFMMVPSVFWLLRLQNVFTSRLKRTCDAVTNIRFLIYYEDVASFRAWIKLVGSHIRQSNRFFYYWSQNGALEENEYMDKSWILLRLSFPNIITVEIRFHSEMLFERNLISLCWKMSSLISTSFSVYWIFYRIIIKYSVCNPWMTKSAAFDCW